MTNRSIRTFLPALVTALVTLAPGPGTARADRHPPGSERTGDIAFVRGPSLWLLPAGGGAEPVAIATLGDEAARVTRLKASPQGTAVLLELGDRVAWVPVERDHKQPGRVHRLDCTGPARFTPPGSAIACTGRNGQAALHPLRPDGARPVSYPAGQILGFAKHKRVVIRDTEGLWADTIDTPGQRTLLTPHLPSDALLVAPDGRHAVGVYPPLRKADTPGLYAFRLDGKGIRRRMLRDARPVVWSMDSRWLLAQSTKEGACIVRASGGEYKCWARYQAISLAPDGSHALLGKRPKEGDGTDLYIGKLAGVRPERPTPLQRAITGPAVWLPPPK